MACRGASLIRNSPPPYDPPRTPDIVLLQGPKGALFLMSEAPLWCRLPDQMKVFVESIRLGERKARLHAFVKEDMGAGRDPLTNDI